MVKDLTAERLKVNKEIRSISSLLPPIFNQLNFIYYYTTDTYQYLILKIILFYAGVLILSFNLSVFITQRFKDFFQKHKRLLSVIAILFFLVITLYVLKDGLVNWRRITTIMTLIGVNIGIILTYIRNKNVIK